MSRWQGCGNLISFRDLPSGRNHGGPWSRRCSTASARLADGVVLVHERVHGGRNIKETAQSELSTRVSIPKSSPQMLIHYDHSFENAMSCSTLTPESDQQHKISNGGSKWWACAKPECSEDHSRPRPSAIPWWIRATRALDEPLTR